MIVLHVFSVACAWRGSVGSLTYGWVDFRNSMCDTCVWLKGKDLALKVLKRLFLVLHFLSVSTGKIPNFRERKEAKINILEVK